MEFTRTYPEPYFYPGLAEEEIRQEEEMADIIEWGAQEEIRRAGFVPKTNTNSTRYSGK